LYLSVYARASKRSHGGGGGKCMTFCRVPFGITGPIWCKIKKRSNTQNAQYIELTQKKMDLQSAWMMYFPWNKFINEFCIKKYESVELQIILEYLGIPNYYFKGKMH
jgi:hypothetical protein